MAKNSSSTRKAQLRRAQIKIQKRAKIIQNTDRIAQLRLQNRQLRAEIKAL